MTESPGKQIEQLQSELEELRQFVAKLISQSHLFSSRDFLGTWKGQQIQGLPDSSKLKSALQEHHLQI